MIAIPNMSKPKSCYNHCPDDFITNEEIGCPLKTYKESHQYKNGIHPDCPLIEIVPCKECIYNTDNTDGDNRGWCYKHGIDIIDFCSEGER